MLAAPVKPSPRRRSEAAFPLEVAIRSRRDGPANVSVATS